MCSADRSSRAAPGCGAARTMTATPRPIAPVTAAAVVRTCGPSSRGTRAVALPGTLSSDPAGQSRALPRGRRSAARRPAPGHAGAAASRRRSAVLPPQGFAVIEYLGRSHTQSCQSTPALHHRRDRGEAAAPAARGHRRSVLPGLAPGSATIVRLRVARARPANVGTRWALCDLDSQSPGSNDATWAVGSYARRK